MKKRSDPDQDPLTLLRTDGRPRRSLTQQPPGKLLLAIVGLAAFMAVLLLLYGLLDQPEAAAAIPSGDPGMVAS